MIHETALVEPGVILGKNVRIWMQVQVRSGAVIGDGSIVGKGAYVGLDVKIGRNCKIQNAVSLFKGVELGNGVFIGPHVCFTNDKVPRAVNPDMKAKGTNDWNISSTKVDDGASIGAGSIILPGIAIGAWAMVGAGSTVTHDVKPHTLVIGTPAREIANVCKCGNRFPSTDTRAECPVCNWRAERANT